MRVSLIVAADEHDMIGTGGELPWHLPADLARFRRLTVGHAVVTGRRTHESVLRRLGHPLDGRITVVLSRSLGEPSDGRVLGAGTVDRALGLARAVEAFAGRDEVFVIGGAQVFTATLSQVDRVYLTRVHTTVAGDTSMPPGWLNGFTLVSQEDPGYGDQAPDAVRFTYLTYERG